MSRLGCSNEPIRVWHSGRGERRCAISSVLRRAVGDRASQAQGVSAESPVPPLWGPVQLGRIQHLLEVL